MVEANASAGWVHSASEHSGCSSLLSCLRFWREPSSTLSTRASTVSSTLGNRTWFLIYRSLQARLWGLGTLTTRSLNGEATGLVTMLVVIVRGLIQSWE